MLAYVLREQGKPVSAEVNSAANTLYCDLDFVPELCAELTNLDEERRDEILGGRNRTARDLANWWEDHQEADRQRELEEKQEREKERLRAAAVSKLSPEELEALTGRKIY